MKKQHDMHDENQERSWSIGELSARTGISVLRIRAWETRHGVPVALRADSGHRRYGEAEALRLELLAQGIRTGGRIGELAALSIDELAKRLPRVQADPVEGHSGRWVGFAVKGQEQALHDELVRNWEKAGWLGFVETCAVPFLHEIGNAWEEGTLSVAQEHFGSGVLLNFLEERWRLRNASNTGRPLVLAMLPEDTHSFGLHLCALAAAHADCRVIWLGPNSPMATILSAMVSWDACGLCLSHSVVTSWTEVRSCLLQLRHGIRKELPVYAGGAGFRGPLKGIRSFKKLGDFHDHLAHR
ncbi:MAG: hypothetical protein RL318_2294 [Fibrobacterota bacterium]|jgi:DNA-binding transcriptional MerR regulator/methylmalonyl-CoA mutase cobalamin-binding subunit